VLYFWSKKLTYFTEKFKYLTTPMTVALEPRSTSSRGPPLSPALEGIFTTNPSFSFFQHIYVRQKLLLIKRKGFFA
jgi:hypothetical protein